ncbi:leucine zipper domain-containing protein [Desulfobacula sp.]|uniref:leucine zipper domain-containing protein n=1 Tax=Desulfobacula sp. TaxID=2593537 RepID=UPI00345B7833|nr:helix-turn-helix domain-containing protein [Desulfobacula sp.]
MDKSEMAMKRVELIMKVNCGLMTASQAARDLKVSRKTYYKWEKKALTALLGSVTDRQPGRPEIKPRKEQELLEKKLKLVMKQNEVLHRRMALKDILSEIKPGSGDRVKKK